MADELTLNIKLRFNNGATDITWSAAVDLGVDVAGEQHVWHRQNIGTSYELLDSGDLTNGGYVCMVNRDNTNFIRVAPNNDASPDTDLVKLLPGEVALFRVSGSAPFAKADTAACELEYFWLDL